MAVLINSSYSEGLNLFGEDSYSTVQVDLNKEEDMMNDTIIPFIKMIEEEVKLLPKKRQKRFFNMIRVSSMMIIPLAIAKNANAQMITTSAKPINIPFIENQQGLSILPPEIFQLLIQLIGGAMMLGSLVAILLLIAAGTFKMLGQSEKAKRWTTEILKGFGITLLAPAIIILLVAITSLVLGGIDGLDVFY